jgi:hypothetical protein
MSVGNNGTQPSTSPRYGASTAVSAMSTAQLSTYYFVDVALGDRSSIHGPRGSGLKDLLADGRAIGDAQDFEDALFCRRQVLGGN